MALAPRASRSLGAALRSRTLQSALVCLFYAASSLTLSVVNKAVLTSYDFHCYFLLLAVQLAVALVFCSVSRMLGNPFSIPSIRSWAHLAAAVPMATCFVLNVAVGFVALRLVNMPMFFCIRRLTPTFVMALDYLVEGVVVTRLSGSSVVVLFVGTILAGWETLRGDALGYALAFANDIATALQLLFQKRFNDSQKTLEGARLGSFGLVYFNAAIALPLTLVGAGLSGEFAELAAYPRLADRGFLGAVLTSAALGVVLTYAGILCTTFNSPLTTSMTGCAKDVVGTAVGALLFGDFDFTPTSSSGLTISFVGSGMYVWDGWLESRRARKEAQAAPPSEAQAGAEEAAAEVAAEAEASQEPSGVQHAGLFTARGNIVRGAQSTLAAEERATLLRQEAQGPTLRASASVLDAVMLRASSPEEHAGGSGMRSSASIGEGLSVSGMLGGALPLRGGSPRSE